MSGYTEFTLEYRGDVVAVKRADHGAMHRDDSLEVVQELLAIMEREIEASVHFPPARVREGYHIAKQDAIVTYTRPTYLSPSDIAEVIEVLS